MFERTLQRTLRCAKRANRIIGDLLDVTYTRVHGELGVNVRKVDLKKVLEDVGHVPMMETPDLFMDALSEWNAHRIPTAAAS